MRGFRWMMILLCFSIDVRLKAIEQEPQACLKKVWEPCSLFTFRPKTTNLGPIKLTMQAGSILYRGHQGQWNFVAGVLRVANSKTVNLKTKLGDLTLLPGVTWLQWRDDKLWIYSVEGGVQVDLLSSLIQDNIVAAGFYNWFGAIDRDGRNQQGIPRYIDVAAAKKVLPGFAQHQDRKYLEKRLSRRIAMAADFYQTIIEQTEADERERQRAIEQKETQRRLFEKGIRDRFRNKYLSPVDLDDGDETLSN